MVFRVVYEDWIMGIEYFNDERDDFKKVVDLGGAHYIVEIPTELGNL